MIWHSATSAEVEVELKTSRANGLTSDQAAIRLQQVGENSLKRKKGILVASLFFSTKRFYGDYPHGSRRRILCGDPADRGKQLGGTHRDCVIIIVNALLGVIQETGPKRQPRSSARHGCAVGESGARRGGAAHSCFRAGAGGYYCTRGGGLYPS